MSGFFNSLKNFASGAANAASSASKYQEEEGEDTRMRFTLIPQPGESGFIQWLDAMKMVAKLQGGIPPEFRKRLWLTLAERHLAERGVDWKQAEKICFNEWSNPDDDELGIQIVKDLHRTGCSLFCGAAGRDNQAVLRRVLLGFARWNKSVGYCQGLNVLAALILQVVDRAESSAVKVMIYLVEGVLPEAYFADNLRGLSIDMAVFRDLLRIRLPKLSRHLEALQSDTKDKNVVGSNYEPPLTNVFTMQWFLTLFCHCLPQEAVLRVWDLIFLEGDEVLLRTALAIWEGLTDRIMPVTSADEFYSIMGVLTREMLEFTDTNYLIKRIVNMGPLYGVTSLREKHRFNITPWARRLSDDDETDTEEEERISVETAAAMINMSQKMKKDRSSSPMGALLPSSDRERLALDISSLKQQYAKLRERQRQAHIILSAACARQSMVSSPSSPAMNHLLVGKTALVSGKARQIGPPYRMANVSKVKPTPTVSKMQNREDKHGVTLHWKDMKKGKDNNAPDVKKLPSSTVDQSPEGMSELARTDSDSDSTSTELCDEPDRLSDLDSGDPSSTSECGPDKWSPGDSPMSSRRFKSSGSSEFQDIADRIDKLSAERNDSADKATDLERGEVEGDRPRFGGSDDGKEYLNDMPSDRRKKSDSVSTEKEFGLENKRIENLEDMSAQMDGFRKLTESSAKQVNAEEEQGSDDGDIFIKPLEMSTTDLEDTFIKPLDVATAISYLDNPPSVIFDKSLGTTSNKSEKTLEREIHSVEIDSFDKPMKPDYLKTMSLDDTRSFESETFNKPLCPISNQLPVQNAEKVSVGSNFKELDITSDMELSLKQDKPYFLNEPKINGKVVQIDDTFSEVDSCIVDQASMGEDSYKINHSRISYVDRNFLERYEETKAKIEESFLGRYSTETDKEPEFDVSEPKITFDKYKDLTTETHFEKTISKKGECDFSAYEYTDIKLDFSRESAADNSYENNKTEDQLNPERDNEFTNKSFKTKGKYDVESYGADQIEFGYSKAKSEDKKEKDKHYFTTKNLEFHIDSYNMIREYPENSMDNGKLDDTSPQKYDYKLDLVTSKSDHENISWRLEDFTYKSKSSYQIEDHSNLDLHFSSEMYSKNSKMTFQEDPPSEPKFSLDSSDLLYTERDKNAKSPESTKSFSSGETMGPDSKISTITDLSPRTPMGSDNRGFHQDKFKDYPESSDSKTLTLRSVESEDSKLKRMDQLKTSSVEISSPWTTMSTDSLQNKSDASPKLVVSASSSDSYSPGKFKSSERSFSSDLQSPVSANSINYQFNYKSKDGNPSDSPSIETIAITSPFYPIAHPNQKTPSPYSSTSKPKFDDSIDTSPRIRNHTYDDGLKSSLFTQYSNESNNYDYKSKYKPNPDLIKPDDFKYEDLSVKYEETTRRYVDDMVDSYTEDDTLSPLPRESKFEFHHRGRDERKLLGGMNKNTLFERSCSSLDKNLGDLKSSSSSDEFVTKAVKKRSSDILEDIRHLEAKSQDGSKDTSNLTKNTGYIWEDVQNLEARRQDTFSDSARSFSKESLNKPTISVSTDTRKTYIVEPKINIDDNSILKTIIKNKDEGDDCDDDRESKLGVWTKVKPRKKGENGRRSSDRALKIIQENSAILQRILTCQAKKRLPDLEAISKEITISPINEEISKIFSPILEKIGLNEHEINEELARINFKDFDPEISTCGSEFDAKINDELSKLSIIDDNEEVNHLALDDIISEDYLNTREALIDRQINEELSKLLANYDDANKARERIRYFSYKSCNSDTSSVTENMDYQDPVPRYVRELSPKSDIDIYHELERLNHLSTTHPLPSTSTIDIAYDPSVPYTTPKYSPKLEEPQSSPYDSYKMYDYNSKLSPGISDNMAIASTQKSPVETNYDFSTRNAVHLDYKTSLLSKEMLEFRVRYDQEDSDTSNLVFPESNAYYKTPEKYTYDSLNSYHIRKYDLTSPSRYSYDHSTDYDESSDLVSHLPGLFDSFSRSSKLSSGYKDATKRPVSHPEFPDNPHLTKYADVPSRDSSAYRTSSLSLDNIGQKPVLTVDTTPSPKAHFSPFPVRNATRKPKELALKLGLYSPTSPTTMGPLKRS